MLYSPSILSNQWNVQVLTATWDYLYAIRDTKHLPKICEYITGVEVLHFLGYAYRDLKPDNIMIYFFLNKISHLRNSATIESAKETSGCHPVRPTMKDGSSLWDIWALDATILEAEKYFQESIMVYQLREELSINGTLEKSFLALQKPQTRVLAILSKGK